MSVAFSITGGGLTIPLKSTPDETGDFVLTGDTTGLAMAPVKTRTRSGAGAGSVVTGRRVLERTIACQLVVQGSGRDEIEQRLISTSTALMADDAAIVATDDNGDAWEMGVVVSDTPTGYDHHGGDVLGQWTFELTAPDPYWRRRTVESFSAGVDDSAPAFLDALAQLRLGRSQAIADTTITNSGAVSSPVSWRFIGPADAGTSVSIGGRGFTIDRALAVGDVVEVTPRWGRTPLVTLNGTVDFTVLGVAPRFPELEPGANAVALSMPGAVAGVWEPSGDVEAVNAAVNPSLRTTASGLTQDGASFTLTTGDPGQLAFHSETDVTCAVFDEFTGWTEPWISTRWEASGDGVHAVLEFWAGDLLAESHWSDTVSGGWLSFGGVAIPEGTTKVRVGVGWHGQSGTLQRNQVIFQQASYEFFDGSSGDAYSWEGTADASASVKHVMVKVGGSRVEATWHPSKEVVF